MPKKYNRENWQGTKVEIEFRGIQRIFPFWPYYVGDRIKFHIRATRLNEKAQRLTESAIWEKLPQYKNPILLPGLKRTPDAMIMEVECEGEIITEEGNVSYYFGHLNYFGDGFPLITADVIHNDKQVQTIAVILVTSLVSFACVILAWLLGFITVRPFWEIWIP